MTIILTSIKKKTNMQRKCFYLGFFREVESEK